MISYIYSWIQYIFLEVWEIFREGVYNISRSFCVPRGCATTPPKGPEADKSAGKNCKFIFVTMFSTAGKCVWSCGTCMTDIPTKSSTFDAKQKSTCPYQHQWTCVPYSPPAITEVPLYKPPWCALWTNGEFHCKYNVFNFNAEHLTYLMLCIGFEPHKH